MRRFPWKGLAMVLLAYAPIGFVLGAAWWARAPHDGVAAVLAGFYGAVASLCILGSIRGWPT